MTAGSSEGRGQIVLDGRLLRSQRTRVAIVDATLALVDAGDLEPTAPRVAEQAGVSVRSVFQHFDDLQGLFAAVGDRVLEKLGVLALVVDPATDLDERIPVVVAQRSVLLESITPIRRAAIINAWSSVAVTERIAQGHDFLRAELEVAFAPELEAAASERDELLDALDALLSWGMWEQLRGTLALDTEPARALLVRLLRSTLAAYRWRP